ncbi:MAG: ABC transporter permease [Planctomycetota bacterium]|nr:ABC transporter permease [Planctomycetota bacterium]MDA1179888.1 ABC transporter permease [Planctomycetota bacterium]
MSWIAMRMLIGDTAKYLGLIFGISFATLLMTQQISIFVGIMKRTASQVLDVRDAPIWVMDEKTRFIDEAPGIPEGDLERVRGVTGVDWAARLYKGQVTARLEGGEFRAVVLFGLDDATLVGAPAEMIRGQLSDLRQPDAFMVDKSGYEYMWPGEPLILGRVVELNDRRARLVGICKASAPFTTLPVLYTRYSIVRGFVPGQRTLMNYILASPKRGSDPLQVCVQINKVTGLAAYTQEQFFWKTIKYFLSTTGIPVNFGITITLGFLVGAAITGQTFYLFTLENLKQFGVLKAMGVSNSRIVGMVLLQGAVVGLLGFGIGIGLTAAFFESTKNITHLAGLYLVPEAAVGVGVAVMMIVSLAAMVASMKVLWLEPAQVFRG